MIHTRAVAGAVLAAALTTFCGCAAVPTTDGASPATRERDSPAVASDETPSLMSVGCKRLGKQAAEISDEQSNGMSLILLKVRAPRIIKDNRETYKLPKGDKETLLLSCRGTGVWSDMSKSPVLLRWTVDADGDDFVAYEPIT
jgi:hypothetical protein